MCFVHVKQACMPSRYLVYMHVSLIEKVHRLKHTVLVSCHVLLLSCYQCLCIQGLHIGSHSHAVSSSYIYHALYMLETASVIDIEMCTA